MRLDLQDVMNKTQYLIICVCHILDLYLFCLALMANVTLPKNHIQSLITFHHFATWHPIRTEGEFPSCCCSESFYDSLSLRGEAQVLLAALRTHATRLVLPLQTHILWLPPAVLLQPGHGGLPPGLSTEKAFHYCPICPESYPSSHPRGGLPHSSGLLTIHVSFLDACFIASACPTLCGTPWMVSRQAPLSMGFSRQEYWSGLPCLFPGDHPNSGIELTSLKSPTLAVGSFTTSATWEAFFPGHPV